MKLALRGTWDAQPAPAGVGGEAHVVVRDGLVSWSWDVTLPGAPRVPPGEPGFLDGLWEHDVVELFLTAAPPADPSPEYLELEVGPAGHWLALAFAGARRRSAELRGLAPAIATSVEGRRWTGSLDARVELPAGAPVRALAACCTTLADGSRLHLCSQPLPGGGPDFHRPSAWSRLTTGHGPGAR